MARPATAGATAGAGGGSLRRGAARAGPPEGPPRPPPIATIGVITIASPSIDEGQESGIHTCDQPHSAARPTVPVSRPETAPNREGRLVSGTGATASTPAASAIQSGKGGVVSPATGPTRSVTRPRIAKK